MTIQTLVSSMNANHKDLIQHMNIQTDCILINQCNQFAYEEFEYMENKIRCYDFAEKGVGLSRNNGLLRATGDLILFSDDDICYYPQLEEKIQSEFERHPEADMIFFNVQVCENRRTYDNEKWKPVGFLNSGRYPTYSLVIRTKKLHQSGVTFSLLFGGGAKYSNGEDSLFIKNCLSAGLKAYASPIIIGYEEERESTWFQGYHEKFFYDRGVLYHYLYGKLAFWFGLRFVYTKKKVMCNEIKAKKAFQLLRKGILEAKK